MKRIAVMSCTHLIGERLAVQEHWLNQAFTRMAGEDVGLVLHCGDLFHSGSVGDRLTPATTVVTAFRRVVERYRIMVCVVDGNHDLNHAPHPPATMLVDQCPFILSVSHFPVLKVPGFSPVFVPLAWPGDRPNFQEVLAGLEQRCRLARDKAGQERVIVFGHLGLRDALFDSGRMADGSWPSSEELLTSVPSADAFILGHVHKRQLLQKERLVLYPGAFMRRTWGESLNVDGWMQLENDGTPCASPFRNLEGPRYIEATHAMSVPQELRVGDNLRLAAGLQPPSEIPMGAFVEVVRSRAIAEEAPVARSDSALHPGMTPAEMLSAWHLEQKGKEVDPEWLKILASLGTPDDAAPGPSAFVSRIDRIRIRGGWTGDHDLALPESSWTSLVGRVGAGKTTVLEIPYAALYGSWPSQGRNQLADAFPGGSGEVSVEFLVGPRGKPFRVDRSTGSLSVLEGGAVKAGPAPAKASLYLVAQVGGQEAWRRISFLAQGGWGDPIDAQDAPRMESFRALLGLSGLDSLRKLIDKEFKPLSNVQDQIEGIESRMWEAMEIGKGVSAEAKAIEESLEKLKLQLEPLEKRVGELAKAAWVDPGAVAKRARVLADQQLLADLQAQLNSGLTPTALLGHLKVAEAKFEDQRIKFEELLRQADRRVKLENTVMVGKNSHEMLCKVGCRDNLLPCPLINQEVRRRDEADEASLELGRSSLPHQSDVEESQRVLKGLGTTMEAARHSLARVEELVANIEAVKARLAEPAPADQGPDEAAVAEHRKCQELLGQLRAMIEKRVVELATAKGHMKRIDQEMAREQAILDKLVPHIPRAKALKGLAMAFSRTGIPLAVCSSAFPEIQRHMDALCEEFFPDFRLQLGAGLLDASGNERPALALMASRKQMPWVDVRAKSRGERAIARLVLRAALARWSCRDAHGRVWMLDEPTADMHPSDGANAVRLMRSLVGPGLPFNQGIVATHDEDLARALGSVVAIGPVS